MEESLKKTVQKFSKDMFFVLTGIFILSFAITAILKPSGLIMGGITGISILLSALSGIEYTYINYVLSITVLLSTYFFLGKIEASKIIFLSICFPLALIIFQHINFNLPKEDIFLTAVYFGVVRGVGSGLVLRSGYSTGGTDSIAKIIHKRFYPYISISILITVIDILVVIASIFIFDLRIALYAMISQVIYLRVANIVMFGFGSKFMKLEIVSDKGDIIEKFILKDIHRGVSKYPVIGAYNNVEHMKLVTICTPRQALIIKNYIATVDQKAFVSLIATSSIWGNGSGFDELKVEQ